MDMNFDRASNTRYTTPWQHIELRGIGRWTAVSYLSHFGRCYTDEEAIQLRPVETPASDDDRTARHVDSLKVKPHLSRMASGNLGEL
jgi:hypothetical protein